MINDSETAMHVVRVGQMTQMLAKKMRLSEDATPIITHIIIVCDVFDALLSERPYKKAWTLDQTVTYLVENSGSHFDPEVVEAFIYILPQIMDIREKFSDHQEEATIQKTMASVNMISDANNDVRPSIH